MTGAWSPALRSGPGSTGSRAEWHGDGGVLERGADDLGRVDDAHLEQVAELAGVNHVLRDDPTDNVGNYARQDPLSAQLTTALDEFVGK